MCRNCLKDDECEDVENVWDLTIPFTFFIVIAVFTILFSIFDRG